MEINTNEQIHPNKIRQVLMLVLLVLLGSVLFREMSFLMSGALGAIALYMLLRRPMFKMVFEWKWKRSLATLTLIVVSLLLIVFPFVFIINILIDKLSPVLSDTDRITANIKEIDKYLQLKFKLNILSKANLDKLPGLLTGLGTKVVSTTFSGLTNLVVMYFILWFMLMKGGEMERGLRRNLPLKHLNTARLLQEVRAMVVSNAIGIPVLAAIQGVIAIIGYSLFGVQEPMLWGIMTGMASVVPFVGCALIWVPIVILKFAAGDIHNAWWLLSWSVLVVGLSDNIFRFVLQKYSADVHPLITVFGVIAGLEIFGFWGLIFGPLMLSMFLLLVRIYNDEFVLEYEPGINPPGDSG